LFSEKARRGRAVSLQKAARARLTIAVASVWDDYWRGMPALLHLHRWRVAFA